MEKIRWSSTGAQGSARRACRNHGPSYDSAVRQTVLIVDDHAIFRASARALLESEGFVVVAEAATGAEALEAAAAARPEIVLLDIQLPDIDGLIVAERLAVTTHPPKVVLYLESGRRVVWAEALAGPVLRVHLEERPLGRSDNVHRGLSRSMMRLGRMLLWPAGLALGVAAERAAVSERGRLACLGSRPRGRLDAHRLRSRRLVPTSGKPIRPPCRGDRLLLVPRKLRRRRQCRGRRGCGPDTLPLPRAAVSPRDRVSLRTGIVTTRSKRRGRRLRGLLHPRDLDERNRNRGSPFAPRRDERPRVHELVGARPPRSPVGAACRQSSSRSPSPEGLWRGSPSRPGKPTS